MWMTADFTAKNTDVVHRVTLIKNVCMKWSLYTRYKIGKPEALSFLKHI